MTPLDLTQRPPRSARVELDGIAYVPRAIDKVRASFPGGNLGEYFILLDTIPTMSAIFYRRMGITHDEFAAAVRDAATEEDVAAWLRPRIDDENIAKWHKQLLDVRICDIKSPARETVLANHPGGAGLPDTAYLVDVFDADDAALFAQK
ncbi:MAG: hypothetical protein NVS3B7_14830 [Candidatus Elarobacter sp.]